MKARHQAREWAMQFLFQRDLNQGDLPEAVEDFWQMQFLVQYDEKPSGDDEPSREEFDAWLASTATVREYAESLIRGVESHRMEIDAIIQKYAQNWDVHRMGGVDRNLIRIALYEMIYQTDVPPVVSINEAVEIAKMHSSFESGRFVNGILDRIRKDLDRPARTPATSLPHLKGGL